MIVPVNAGDVRRLSRASGLPPERIVRLYSPRSVEFQANSPLWVKTRYGPRIMALQRIKNKCRFLTSAGQCRVYASRPSTCGTFPYEIRFRNRLKKPDVDRSDWPLCPARPASTPDRQTVLRLRRREMREDKAFLRLLRAWEDNGTGNTPDLMDYLFRDS